MRKTVGKYSRQAGRPKVAPLARRVIIRPLKQPRQRTRNMPALGLLRVRRGMERRGLRRRGGRASRAAGGGVEDFSSVEFNEKRDEFDRL